MTFIRFQNETGYSSARRALYTLADITTENGQAQACLYYNDKTKKWDKIEFFGVQRGNPQAFTSIEEEILLQCETNPRLSLITEELVSWIERMKTSEIAWARSHGNEIWFRMTLDPYHYHIDKSGKTNAVKAPLQDDTEAVQASYFYHSNLKYLLEHTSLLEKLSAHPSVRLTMILN
jgi:hypothetical protein